MICYNNVVNNELKSQERSYKKRLQMKLKKE